MNIKLFTITHKSFTPPPDPMYIPLHVGRANAEDLGFLGDETGDSISHLNPYFCELTGMYWIWKNYHDVDYTGICHYRRYLLNEEGKIFTHEQIENLLQSYDILTTKLLTLPGSYYNGFGANHHTKDLINTGNVLKERKEVVAELRAVRSGSRWGPAGGTGLSASRRPGAIEAAPGARSCAQRTITAAIVRHYLT